MRWRDPPFRGSSLRGTLGFVATAVAAHVVVLAAMVAMVTIVGCSPWSCDGTHLEAMPISRSALTGPVTLEARLTAGGDPVRRAPILFFILWAERPQQGSGRVVGEAMTDEDGIARISFRGGLAALEPADVIIGYSVEFRFTGSVPGRENQLCRSQGNFKFS